MTEMVEMTKELLQLLECTPLIYPHGRGASLFCFSVFCINYLGT